MEPSNTPLKAALATWAAESRPSLDRHPTPDELVAYQEGTLAAAEDERVQEHLVFCRDCSALLLDLADFETEDGVSTGAPVPSEGDIDVAWGKLQAQLAPASAVPEPGLGKVLPMVPPAVAAPEAPRRWWRSGLALAATYVLAAGLGLWVVALRQENRALRQPFQGVPLSLSADRTRGAREARSFSSSQVVVLDVPGAVRVDIVEGEGPGHLVWTATIQSTAAVPDGTLVLPARSLAPGHYRFRLFGTTGDPVEYPVEVSP